MSDAALGGAEPVRRTEEIEDPSNLYFIHPLSARLVPLCARLGVKPNAVSLAGMACGLLAGLSYYFYQNTGCAILGFALMLAWHVLDGADGQLARLTKSYSELGKVLDGICDYVTFTAVYAGLALALSHQLGPWVWALAALSGLAHAVQSAAYEMQRQEYNFWGWGRNSAALPELRARPRGLAGWLHHLYARVQVWASGGASEFHTRFARIFAARPAQQKALRAAYRAAFAPLVRRWGVLSANYRTLAIFIAVLLKLPVLYFVFEILGLGAAMLVLLEAQRQQYKAFLAGLTR